MTVHTIQQLDVYGPDRCEPMTVEQARRFCGKLARNRYENFSVLSALVPESLRDDFGAVYAFCRWADDLGDEAGDRDRALELLGWWREELEACFAGEPRHPVFVALRPTIVRHELPFEPFGQLIEAFEQDQHLTRYRTWEELLGYCRRSADPVGRLVLMVCGVPRTDQYFERSDAICTALQLTNHWQDVNRDFRDRDRIYLPQDMHTIERFEQRLARTVEQGFAADHTFLAESRRLVCSCVERTWPLYRRGEELLEMIGPATRPIIWLFVMGGQRVLRLVEGWNYETVLHRPKLSKTTRLAFVARAWWGAKRAGAGNGRIKNTEVTS